jgi:hypothetical protein
LEFDGQWGLGAAVVAPAAAPGEKEGEEEKGASHEG